MSYSINISSTDPRDFLAGTDTGADFPFRLFVSPPVRISEAGGTQIVTLGSNIITRGQLECWCVRKGLGIGNNDSKEDGRDRALTDGNDFGGYTGDVFGLLFVVRGLSLFF
jgi:hypothetical protein